MKKTHSAGGVVLNKAGQVLLVSQRGKSWSLPKGHLDPGEDTLTAARREIYEESGVSELILHRELGSYTRYKMGKTGKDDKKEAKTITLFLFSTSQMELCPIDPKHPIAIWTDRENVEELLTHPKDASYFASIVKELPRVP